MFAGSVPVRRFSPNSLPGRQQCKAAAAQRQAEHRATYRLAMDGIEETKAGNRPVSAFRATFLQNAAPRVLRHSGDTHVRTGRASPKASAPGPNPRGSRAYVAKRSTLALGGCGGDGLGRACGSYCESTGAHIDERMRSRVMASGNRPVKFCPLRSLQKCPLTGAAREAKVRQRADAHARYPADARQVAQCSRHRADEHGRCAR